MPVSAIDPIAPAWNRMVNILFKPFVFTKWLALGFCAFLAQCGQGGGGGGGGGGNDSTGSTPQDFQNWMNDVKDLILENMSLVVTLAIVAILLVVGLGLLVTWLSSRGKFMLIDGVVKNRGAIKQPWREYKREGNSLFLFRICVGLAFLVGFVVFASIPLLISLDDIRSEIFGAGALAGLIVGGGLLFVYVILGMTVSFFIEVLVVPTMYLKRLHALEACRVAWNDLLRGHKAATFCFAMMYLVLAIAAIVVVVWGTCMTCCLTVVPYVGSVILLPITVFFTALALEYIQQFPGDWQFFAYDGDGRPCLECGYDLRSTPHGERCPECGRVNLHPDPGDVETPPTVA